LAHLLLLKTLLIIEFLKIAEQKAIWGAKVQIGDETKKKCKNSSQNYTPQNITYFLMYILCSIKGCNRADFSLFLIFFQIRKSFFRIRHSRNAAQLFLCENFF
jgi:hypothetical protein